ncbi:cysteine synthase B [Robiginitalea myxolifaciens]|uniref:Cysteine synthase n=1 Tax=Robiginitalea myxolifaciens TaxID=400055 RepID=A0A1I6GX55_9FLAO|nr:cysteine synthase CysM [Robiginitalea myxolifaciens]SFR46782.1 cysteine synthase B [Robiginitalea myxolifaciens]
MSNNIEGLIGNTPLVKSRALCQKEGVSLYFKLEGQNPGGSVKDRAAYNMISAALERGDINEDIPLIEATSGNTGIALAMIASLYKLRMVLVMPENATQERVDTMRAFGAEVVLTPASDGIEGARDYAEKRRDKDGYFMLNQFGNPDNWKAHYKTTGPEIWADSKGKVTHFVSSMGTTGTIMGTSRYLKEQSEDVRIIGVQPNEGSSIPGIRKWPEAYLPKIYEPPRVDTILEVSESEAKAMARRLAREEGIFAGMSSGGAAAAALKLAETLDSGYIVSIVCDRGDRYLSSDLFSTD